MNRNWKLVGISAALVIGFVILKEHWGHLLGRFPTCCCSLARCCTCSMGTVTTETTARFEFR